MKRALYFAAFSVASSLTLLPACILFEDDATDANSSLGEASNHTATATDMGSVEALCDDGVDDDGDGALDCADDDCADDPSCVDVVEICDNGVDDDRDGDMDCMDADCSSAPSCPSEDCIAPGDEDEDGFSNCADSQCKNKFCLASVVGAICSQYPPFHCVGGEDRSSQCSDGLDNDFDGLTDCMDPDCEGACACGANCSERCDDNIDNDGDGSINEECPCHYLGINRGVCAMARRDLMGACAAPSGYQENDICDDTLDNDCDGIANDGCACNFMGLTAGVCSEGKISPTNGQCEPPGAYETRELSCDDGLDNDCNGVSDEVDMRCQ